MTALAIVPLAGHGGIRQRGQGSGTTLRLGRGRDYLLARLARDHAELLPRIESGELSVRGAAIEARIIRPRRKPHLARCTGEVQWFTPPDVVAAARAALGGIDLDPASCEQAQSTVQAATFYTAEQDGLVRPWRGRVFLNPPYAVRVVDRFVARLVAEVTAGNVTAAVLLTNASTDTAWFHQAASAAAAFCLSRGRLRFVSPAGPSRTPLQGQAVFYFGPEIATFAGVFSAFGLVVRTEASQ